MLDILVTSVEESPHGPDGVRFTAAITLVDLIVSIIIRSSIVLISRTAVQALILLVHSVLVPLITLCSVTPGCACVGCVGHPALSGTSPFSISLLLCLSFDDRIGVGVGLCFGFCLGFGVRVSVSLSVRLGTRVIKDVSKGVAADGRL